MTDSGTTPTFDRDFLAELRRDMLKFAHLQLRDEALAEDAVQEAMGCNRKCWSRQNLGSEGIPIALPAAIGASNA